MCRRNESGRNVGLGWRQIRRAPKGTKPLRSRVAAAVTFRKQVPITPVRWGSLGQRSIASSKSVGAAAVLFGAIWLSSLGCAARGHGTYRVLDRPDRAVLVPPDVRVLYGNSETLTLRPATRQTECPAPGPGIHVTAGRNKVKMSIRQDAFAGRQGGWLSRLADELGDKGCLPRGGEQRFVRTVLEAFPVGVRETYGAAFGQPVTSRFTDFRPGRILKIVGPVLRDAAERADLKVESAVQDGSRGLSLDVRSSENLLGYEESRYVIATDAAGDLRLDHDYTRLYRNGEMTAPERPTATDAGFVPGGRFLRMIYLTRVAETGDHDVLLVSGATRAELEARSEAVSDEPGRCQDSRSGDWCTRVSRDLSLNVFVTVTLNGIEVDTAPGIPLGQFLRNGFGSGAGAVPDELQVWRPHRSRLAAVEFDPRSTAILSLPLLGGERILAPGFRRD